jgi:hypothetical protein
MSPTLTEMIGHIVDYERAGRRVAVGLGLTRLRERYEGLDPEDLPPDEQSWEAFVAKHLPLPAERIAELIGKMVHHGGVLHCTKCGTKSKCGCGCGAPYVGDHRWAIPIAKVEPTKKPSALDRAAVAIAAHPDKSDRAIAAEIGMDHKTVAKARRAMAVSPLDSPPEKRVGRDGRSYPVTTRAIPPTKRGNAG